MVQRSRFGFPAGVPTVRLTHHPQSIHETSLCSVSAQKHCPSGCVGGAGVGWGQLPLGNWEALGGAGRRPEYVTTSVRSPLSSPPECDVLQAAAGPQAMIHGRDERSSRRPQPSALTQPTASLPTDSLLSPPPGSVLRGGSGLWQPGGRGARRRLSRGGVHRGDPGEASSGVSVPSGAAGRPGVTLDVH